MNVDIRLPNITGASEAEQVAQMRSYLYQFAEQLQWALNTIDNDAHSEAVELRNAIGQIVDKTEEAKAQDAFNSIKDLIIKSADIIDAYYDQIDGLIDLSGKYVASSDFGKYAQETKNRIDATDKYVQQNVYSKETVDGMVRNNQGYIRYGIVGTTIPDSDGVINDNATGILIGDFTSTDTSEHISFARYTSAGIELFGESSSVPVATISKYKITITSAEFSGSVKIGKYRLDLSNGIAFKWEG